MINLVTTRLNRTHPDLELFGASDIDAVRQAHVPVDLKRNILDIVWDETGPETLLSIGQEIRNVGYDPIWHAAIRSENPTLLFKKWQRFEVFAHSKNRLRINLISENFASFQRYVSDGKAPTTPENLLICGLIIALLEEIGCLGLRCEMQLCNGETYTIFKDGHFFVPEEPDTLITDTWSIEWQTFSPKTESVVLDADLLEVALPGSYSLGLKASIDAMVQCLMIDIARQWKVGDLALSVGLSTRSLQRNLNEINLSFSSLVRLARIHEACHLLKDNDTPITAVAFCAGFSDSAHFSRDFRASMGMTPSQYRMVFSGSNRR